MAVLKFRIYFEEDDSVYRDIAIRHTQTFFELHEAILRAYDFDNKHKATFFRSNDHWQKGKEITLEKYEKNYTVPPVMMNETTIGSQIRDPNQRFIYLYDFNKNWGFLVELINVAKEENPRLSYPATVRVEGIAPSQYGTKGLLGEKFADVEEKYDLSGAADGFGEEGESESEEETGEETEGTDSAEEI
jgi:Plasmid pRiA4b ORF-3-like protein